MKIKVVCEKTRIRKIGQLNKFETVTGHYNNEKARKTYSKKKINKQLHQKDMNERQIKL